MPGYVYAADKGGYRRHWQLPLHSVMFVQHRRSQSRQGLISAAMHKLREGPTLLIAFYIFFIGRQFDRTLEHSCGSNPRLKILQQPLKIPPSCARFSITSSANDSPLRATLSITMCHGEVVLYKCGDLQDVGLKCCSNMRSPDPFRCPGTDPKRPTYVNSSFVLRTLGDDDYSAVMILAGENDRCGLYCLPSLHEGSWIHAISVTSTSLQFGFN